MIPGWWNELPNSIQSAESLYVFKHRFLIQEYLLTESFFFSILSIYPSLKKEALESYFMHPYVIRGYYIISLCMPIYSESINEARSILETQSEVCLNVHIFDDILRVPNNKE